MTEKYSAHVEAVLDLRLSVAKLSAHLVTALTAAEETRDKLVPAVGREPSEPESARMIDMWVREIVADIDALLTATDNINEQCHIYLRLI